MNKKDDTDSRKSKTDLNSRFTNSLKNGFLSGFATSIILLKVMIPTMVAVWFLKLSGAMDLVAGMASPFMKIFHLPGEASLVLITGGVVNIYAAIAVAVNIPLTAQEMTILAIMVLIAHNLLVETAVQSRTGTPAAIMLSARLGGALSAGFCFARMVPETGGPIVRAGKMMVDSNWKDTLQGNAASLIKIVFIIVGLMIIIEWMREYGIMDRITYIIQAPMRIIGMDARTSFVAAVGLLLGIAYGAGLIIHETGRSEIGREEILATNLFLGTNHALVEDSLIFAAVGANLGWIVFGRLIFGVIFLRLTLPVVLYLWKPEGSKQDPDSRI